MFCGGDTKFSYTACQWIEAEAIEAGKHIHHQTCGHGGERMVTVWVLSDKGEKEPVSFWSMDMNLKQHSVSISCMSLARANMLKKSFKKTTTEV